MIRASGGVISLMLLLLGMVPTMKHLLARTLLAAVLSLWFAASAQAGFNEGLVAFERGDYAAAFEKWFPIAEQGEIARGASQC